MIELVSNQYHITENLLRTRSDNIEPKAVVERNNPGWVFVDSLSDPRVALIWSKGNEGFYLAGPDMVSCSEEINQLIDSVLSPRLQKLKINRFEVSSVSCGIGHLIPKIFDTRELSSWKQCVFTYKKHTLIPVTQQLEGGILCDMKNIIVNCSVSNLDYIESVLLEHWDSIDAFLNNGAGFCVVADGMVASLCYTGWASSNVHEASVKTLEQYRRKGYAEICTAALVNFYLQNGFLPYWECMSTNYASVKLAKKSGFTKAFEYTCYGFNLFPA